MFLLGLATLSACGRLSFGADDAPFVDDADLLAYWPLDESVGSTTFADRSRFQNTGTCTECPTAGVQGVRGTAIEIGVERAGIRVASSPALASTIGPLTIAAWVRLDMSSMYGVIASNDRDCCGTWNGYSLWADHYAEGPALVTWSEGTQALARGGTLSPGVWSHVVGTFDGTLDRIYVDGVEVSVANSAGIAAPHSFDLWIGSLGYAAPDYHLVGAIDELLVLGRALDPSEIADLRAQY